jgi:hypothetical protein
MLRIATIPVTARTTVRTQKPHWPTRSPLQADRPNTEHLLSERALRERIEELSARVEEPGELLAQLDAAIRESRIS